jgi:hypothetical protein
MAKPRMAESSRENADTLANGGHMAKADRRIASPSSAVTGKNLEGSEDHDPLTT